MTREFHLFVFRENVTPLQRIHSNFLRIVRITVHSITSGNIFLHFPCGSQCCAHHSRFLCPCDVEQVLSSELLMVCVSGGLRSRVRSWTHLSQGLITLRLIVVHFVMHHIWENGLQCLPFGEPASLSRAWLESWRWGYMEFDCSCQEGWRYVGMGSQDVVGCVRVHFRGISSITRGSSARGMAFGDAVLVFGWVLITVGDLGLTVWGCCR